MPDNDKATGRADPTSAEDEAESRREFLKTVAKGTAKGATVAPAVAMLLAAVSKPMKARANSYGGCSGGSILVP